MRPAAPLPRLHKVLAGLLLVGWVGLFLYEVGWNVLATRFQAVVTRVEPRPLWPGYAFEYRDLKGSALRGNFEVVRPFGPRAVAGERIEVLRCAVNPETFRHVGLLARFEWSLLAALVVGPALLAIVRAGRRRASPAHA